MSPRLRAMALPSSSVSVRAFPNTSAVYSLSLKWRAASVFRTTHKAMRVEATCWCRGL